MFSKNATHICQAASPETSVLPHKVASKPLSICDLCSKKFDAYLHSKPEFFPTVTFFIVFHKLSRSEETFGVPGVAQISNLR